MNYRLLSKVFGWLLLFVGLAMLLCLLLALFEPQSPERQTRAGFALSFLITAISGGLLYGWGRRAPNEILRKEAIVIVGMAWLLWSAFGSLPFMLCTPALPFAHAFFETMSGFTTTGSTVITDLDVYPNSLIFYRALTHFLGGGGILVMFVALLSFLGVGGKSLMQYEASAQLGEGAISRVRELALRLWTIYSALTATCALGLMLCGMNFFDAVTHAFGTVATGGFSNRDNSIAYYNSVPIEVCLMIFMILGSMNFMIYVAIIQKRWRRVWSEQESRAYLLMLLVATIVIVTNLMNAKGLPFGQALRQAAFPIATQSTTAGFCTTDYDQWPYASQFVLAILMIVGGCSGSTAGGMKMVRLILLGKVLLQELVKIYRPNQVFSLRMNGAVLEDSVRQHAIFFVAFWLSIIMASTLILSFLEPRMDLTTSFGAVLATISNVGPGFHLVGPTQNFGWVSPEALLFMSILMVMGRLELFAILVLFTPSLWRKF